MLDQIAPVTCRKHRTVAPLLQALNASIEDSIANQLLEIGDYINQREQRIEREEKMGQQLNGRTGILPADPKTRDGYSYEFRIQMGTSGRIDCGIFASGLEV